MTLTEISNSSGRVRDDWEIASDRRRYNRFASTNSQANLVESDLSAATRDFISRHIVSVEELEVLLILHEEKDRDWSAAEINERLRSQVPSIEKWLEALVSLRLAATAGKRYRFAPASDNLARETAALADAYRERRIKVIEFIFSKPNENLLNFVRAFELRKRP